VLTAGEVRVRATASVGVALVALVALQHLVYGVPLSVATLPVAVLLGLVAVAAAVHALVLLSGAGTPVLVPVRVSRGRPSTCACRQCEPDAAGRPLPRAPGACFSARPAGREHPLSS
jgi:hypothetical protein